MKLQKGLKTTLSQRMVMTPRMQQAVSFLSLTHLEMSDKIAEEMTENPLLEESADGLEPAESDLQTKEARSEDFELPTVIKKDDFDWDSYVESYDIPSTRTPTESESSFVQEGLPAKGDTLAEHLEWQLRMEDWREKDFAFARELLHNLSEEGYLETPLKELAQAAQMDGDEAERIRTSIQGLDPIGCGSEGLEECLLFQARLEGECSPLLTRLIREYVGKKRTPDCLKVAKEWGVAAEEVKAALEVLKDFHPRPGLLVSNQSVHYIVPDIYVVNAGGEFVVKVNDEGVPRLKISRTYREMLSSAEKGSEVRDYVREKLDGAMWLIKSVQNRRKTLYQVARAIVSRQQGFFKHGPHHLKPMILRDIAEEIGVHDSTVSRATTNKYMHTPGGIFELKYFFNRGLEGKEGAVSSEVVRLKIAQWIESEDPRHPLPDQKIVELLGRENLTVARRTVAKYREKLGLPSAASRRKKY